MKIAIISPFLLRYARGIERFTQCLSESLVCHNMEVDLLTWQWPDPVSWEPLLPNVRVRQVPYLRYFMRWIAVPYYLSWLAHERYDWVMLFFAGYGEAETLSLLRRLRKQPYCVVFHFPCQQVSHRYAEFERFGLARRADRLVAVSRYVARGVEAQFDQECAVIGNGVDPGVFGPAPGARATVRQRLRAHPDTPALITLAALEERKGVQWVVRAIPRLLPEFPDLQYWVLGEGAYRVALNAEIRQLGLESHVHLLGSVNDVVPYLAAADIGCLLSYGESFGIALIEYMAMELPIVASRHPPFGELIRPAWGVMVDERDTEAVVVELRALLRHPRRCRAMGAAGRRQVLQHHTWDQVADDYLRLLTIPSLAQDTR